MKSNSCRVKHWRRNNDIFGQGWRRTQHKKWHRITRKSMNTPGLEKTSNIVLSSAINMKQGKLYFLFIFKHSSLIKCS